MSRSPDAPGEGAAMPGPEFSARMRRDWDERALLNAAYFVDFGAWRTEEEIEAAGRRHGEMLLAEIPRDELERMDALEIGCGIARVLRPLAEDVRTITGIEVSLEMLLVAEQRLSSTKDALLVLGDGLGALPFQDRSFDLVYSCFVFEHIPKPLTFQYLAESKRVLRPRGRLRFQFTLPFQGVDLDGIAGDLSAQEPEGVAALAKGPTFEGDPISVEEMKAYLKGLGFSLEKCELLGANNAGILARLP